MKRLALGICAALAILLLLGVGAGMALSSWMDGLCGATEISRAASTDGRYDAVLFERNCGATTGFATHVSLIPHGAPLPNAAGNLFAADLETGGAPAPWGGPRVSIAWTSNDALAIEHDPAARVLRTAPALHDITVTYHRLSPGV